MNAVLFFLAGLAADTPGPLQCENATVDRGEVKAGAILSQVFVLKNAGTTSVHLTQVEAGCGCLKPQVSGYAIAPNATAQIRVEVNTIAQPAGTNAWKTTIRYTAEGDSKMVHQLEMVQKARIVREIQIEPVALHMSIDRETMHTITIRDLRDKPLTLTAARCGHSHVKTQLSAVGVNAKGERIQQVHVTVLADCPAGVHSEVVQLISEDSCYREFRIPLTIVRKAPDQISATPEQIALRLADGQTSASGLIRLRDPEDKTIVVEKMEADHPALRMKWAAGPGAMATLRLGVESIEKGTSGSGSVRVFIKEPKPQILVIPVAWQTP